MKKIFAAIVGLISLCTVSRAQDVTFSLEYKAGPDSFYVYMTPLFNDAPPFTMGLSQVSLVFNSTFPVSSPASSSISLTSVALPAWTVQDFGQAPGGLKFVTFLTLGANLGTVNNGDRILLFRFRVNGGNCLPGTTLRVYANGIDPVDPASEFADFTAFINEGGNDHLANNANVSMLTCLQLILPVNILEFNARRDNSNGVLNWSVIGEENKSDYYELERSLDGTVFTPFATIPCRKLPGIQRYEFIDVNVARLNAKVVYYRLKQYDIDAKFTLSGIRQLRFDISQAGVQMYPNPVTSGFYVIVPFANPDQSKVSLVIINNAGQPVQSRNITAQQATNYYFDIRNLQLAAGDYYLRVVHDDQVVEVKKFMKVKD